MCVLTDASMRGVSTKYTKHHAYAKRVEELASRCKLGLQNFSLSGM